MVLAESSVAMSWKVELLKMQVCMFARQLGSLVAGALD